jgi:hypothetical protein
MTQSDYPPTAHPAFYYTIEIYPIWTKKYILYI